MTTDRASTWLRQALGLPDDQAPFPWQEALLGRFIRGEPVDALDLPTGLGKTSVMAIWLVARALGAPVPRRLVYVVDRRAVVDQATDVAEKLRELVGTDPALGEALSLDGRGLPISTLRGHHVDNKAWLEDPTLPAIVVGTVDMVGSRLLFEGYATSRKMRPYHAGLLGSDTLVVLDEAHLVPPFEYLLESVVDDVTLGPADAERRALVPRLRLLTLSATGRRRTKRADAEEQEANAASQSSGNNAKHSLTLGDEDKTNLVVQKRIHAKKTVSRRTVADAKELAPELARAAWELTEEGQRPARIIVFCDRRTDAVAVRAHLLKLGAQTGSLELFVGARRVFEREQLADWLKAKGFLADSKAARATPDGPSFVVATSAGEVGVDLDADHTACDLVAWERMVQRLGRVNRRGDGDAKVVVVEVDAAPDKSLESALTKPREELSEKEHLAVAAHEARTARATALAALLRSADASPAALLALNEDEAQQATLAAARTPSPLRPALTRALVDAWSMTSLRDHTGRPEVAPWLRGWIEEESQTTVAWRTHLPLADGDTGRAIDGFFEAAPLHLSELLEAKSSQVLDWLEDRVKALSERRDQGPSADGPLNPALALTAFLRSSHDESFEKVHLAELLRDRKGVMKKLSGATLVLHATLGGLTEGLLDDSNDDPAPTADGIRDPRGWLEADGEPAVRFKVVPMRVPIGFEADGNSPTSAEDENWIERYQFVTERSGDEPVAWLAILKWRDDAATEDDRGAASKVQVLDEHQSWVEARARRIGQRLRLPLEWIETLALAGRLHDEGKRSRRWQLAFNAPSDGAAYAKTRGPIRHKLLGNYRHELGSLPYAEREPRLSRLSPEQRDLVLHLIAAHHGFARPLIAPDGCDDGPPSVIEERVRQVALRFLRLQRQWGPWGLAWWEALLRAADQQASRELEASNKAPKGGAR